jgi:hypothetical protein
MSWFIEGIEVPEVETTAPTLRRGAEAELRCRFPSDFRSEYDDLAAHADVAGNYAIHTSNTGNNLRYNEKDIRSDTPSVVDNVVLSVDASDRAESFWGGLDEVADESRGQRVDYLTLSFTIIALKRDYASRSALESELKGGNL